LPIISNLAIDLNNEIRLEHNLEYERTVAHDSGTGDQTGELSDRYHHRQGDSNAALEKSGDSGRCFELFALVLSLLGEKFKDRLWKCVGALRARARAFLGAAQAASLEPWFVVDCGWASEENGNKWMKRREREMRTGSRRMSPGADDILCIVLQELGAQVYCAVGMDGDDIVAKLAHVAGPNSLVLSGDNDMLRYDLQNIESRLKADFEFACPILRLVPQTNMTLREGTVLRKVVDIPYEPEVWLGHTNRLLHVQLAPRGFERGCTSPIDKMFGNLHILVRPLRQVSSPMVPAWS
jgi:hypothetical protein